MFRSDVLNNLFVFPKLQVSCSNPRGRRSTHCRRRKIRLRCARAAPPTPPPALLDIMHAGAPYTVIERVMHIHPTVTELIPTMLEGLQPAS